jgi:GT2 family glycosyltransferase
MTDLTRLPNAGTVQPGLPRPVAVIGPRSSATERLIERLATAIGVLLPDEARDPAREIDERLLGRLGVSRSAPIDLSENWARAATLDELRADAARLFARTGKSTPVLLVDPALSQLFPFWQTASEEPFVLVALVPGPQAAAEYAASANSGALVKGLALVEHELRAALTANDGGPVFVAAVDELESEEDLDLLAKAIARFVADPNAPLDSSPRAPQHPSGDALLPEIEQLWRTAHRLLGAHRQFEAPELGTASAWGVELLRLGADVEQLAHGLVWASEQLESVLDIVPPRPARTRENPDSDDVDDQFHEPQQDEPYRLDASEDRHAYHLWLTERREPIIIGGIDDTPERKARTRAEKRSPLVSVLMPVFRPPRWALERAVGSVLAQRAADWQLCICDDGSHDGELTSYLRNLERLDRRIRVTALDENGGISAATNAALGLASGEFVAFLDQDDELAPTAIGAVAAAVATASDVDVLYSDEDKIDVKGERFAPFFKPEWSPDLLLSYAYICHLTVVRRSIVSEVGGLRSQFDGSQDYDLSLRATELARRIVHIPQVLYHWRAIASSTASGAAAKPWAFEAGRLVVADALARRGEAALVTEHPRFAGRYHVRRQINGKPRVSAIIPFRDEPELLATCATSLRADPGYDNFELVLVDNGSELPETEALLDRLGTQPNVVIVRAPGPFNWAAINNAAARVASGELLLFANNDIEARVGGWLDAMVGHAQRLAVGAVGARLVYPDGAIQHAGVAIGLGGIAGHVLRGLPSDRPGYASMAIVTRDCSVVTGACVMVRREVFDEVGGFDEQLPVAFNDVDFCLKLREKGYLIVYTPLAELVHHESRSRGHTDDDFEKNRVLARWGEALAAGDPYLNVHLSHWRYWCPLSTAQEDYRWKTYLETPASTPASSSSK